MVENVADVQDGLGLKLMNAVVPLVPGATFVNAAPPAVYPVPDTSSELPVIWL